MSFNVQQYFSFNTVESIKWSVSQYRDEYFIICEKIQELKTQRFSLCHSLRESEKIGFGTVNFGAVVSQLVRDINRDIRALQSRRRYVNKQSHIISQYLFSLSKAIGTNCIERFIKRVIRGPFYLQHIHVFNQMFSTWRAQSRARLFKVYEKTFAYTMSIYDKYSEWDDLDEDESVEMSDLVQDEIDERETELIYEKKVLKKYFQPSVQEHQNISDEERIERCRTVDIERCTDLLNRLRSHLSFLCDIRTGHVKAYQGVYYESISKHYDKIERLLIRRVQTPQRQFVNAVPEMDVSKVSEDGVMASDLKGNVNLTSARVEDTVVTTVPEYNWCNYVSSDIVGNYKEMTDRWLKVVDFDWTKDHAFDTHLLTHIEGNQEVPGLVLPRQVVENDSWSACDMPNTLPFKVHRYWRGTMVVKIQLNSNKFQIGQLQASWYYQPELDSNILDRLNVYTLSQTHHVLINASSSNEVELRIPYKGHMPMIHTRKRNDIYSYLSVGRLYLKVLNRLSMATGGPDKCSGAVFVRFEDNEFTGMVSGALPQMDTIAKAALGALNGVASCYNEDNPPDVRAPMYIVPTATHSWANGTGVTEPLQTLRLDAKGRTAHPDKMMDEMKVKYVASKWGLVKILDNWTTQSKRGELLFSCDASPLLDKNVYREDPGQGDNKLSTYAVPPVGVVASLFNYWRGSMEFKFDIVASQFHTGRFVVGYVPGATKDTKVELKHILAGPHVVFTLQELQSFSYTIPYVANAPFWNRRYQGNYVDDQVIAPSRLYVFVLNPLVNMQSIVDKVFMNVYMRGSDNFEVSIPVQPSLGTGFFRNVWYNVGDGIKALTGYSPYYPGQWHGFWNNQNSQVLVMRWGAASDEMAEFSTTYLNKSTDSIGYYYKIENINQAPRYLHPSTNEMVPCQYGIVFYPYESEKRYAYMMVCETEQKAMKAAGMYQKGHSWKDIADNGIVPISTTANTYGTLNPLWVAHEITIKLEDDYVFPESPIGVSTTYKFSSTGSGMMLYGERFNDLKDLARRYQTYASLNMSPKRNMQPGQCSYIIPIMPQALDLQIKAGLSFLEQPNRSRDGHIPIICSGYRYYRGGIRIRIVFPPVTAIAWVQHRPDRKMRSLNAIPCSVIETGESVANHSYASYIQDLSVNSVLEIEIPFYQNSSYGLLQRPKLTKKIEDFYYGLGELAVGLMANKSDSKDIADFPAVVYYSLADDMQCSTFQGFPPMVLLDDIATANPQMGLRSFMWNKLGKPMVEDVSNSVKEEMSDVVNDISGNLEKMKDQIQAFGFGDVLNSSFGRNLITNLTHCLVNFSWKNFSVAVVSILMELGIVVIDGMTKCIDAVHHFLLSMCRRCGWPDNITSGTEPKLPDNVSEAEEAMPNMDTEELYDHDKALTGLIGIIWMGLCSVVAICDKKGHLTEMGVWKSLLTKDMRHILSTTNLVFVFLRNLFNVLNHMKTYVVNKCNPAMYNLKCLGEEYARVTAWCEEVIDLCDPQKFKDRQYQISYQTRVSIAYLEGCSLNRMLMQIDNPKVEKSIIRYFKDIHTLRERMVKIGLDSYARKEPFVIWHCGNAGIGKSSLTTPLVHKILKHRKIKSNSAPIFNFEASSNFWDMCQQNPCMVVDDIFNVMEGDILTKHLMLLFALASSVPLCPPKARLEDKEVCYNPDLVVLNSNRDFPEIVGILDDAIFRRRDILVKSQLSHTNIVPNCPHCFPNTDPELGEVGKKLTIKQTPARWLEDFHHLEFHIARDVRNPSTRWDGPYNYEQFIDIVLKKADLEMNKNEEMYRSRLKMMEELIDQGENDSMSLAERFDALKQHYQDQRDRMQDESIYNYISDKFKDAKLAKQYLIDLIGTKAKPEMNPFEIEESLILDYNYTLTNVREKDKKDSPIVVEGIKERILGYVGLQCYDHLEDILFDAHMYGGLKMNDIIENLDIDDVRKCAPFFRSVCDMLKARTGFSECRHPTSFCMDRFTTENGCLMYEGKPFEELKCHKTTNSHWSVECQMLEDDPTHIPQQRKYCLWDIAWYRNRVYDIYLRQNPTMIIRRAAGTAYMQRRCLPQDLRTKHLVDMPDESTWKKMISVACETAFCGMLVGTAVVKTLFYLLDKVGKFFITMAPFLVPLFVGVSLGIRARNKHDDSMSKKEMKWTEPEGLKYTYDTKISQPHLKTPIAKFESQPPQVEEAIKKVLHNSFQITCVFGVQLLKCHGLMLDSRRGLILRHYIEEFKAVEGEKKFYFKYHLRRKAFDDSHGISINFLDCEMKYGKVSTSEGDIGSNYVIVYFPNSVSMCKSLIPLISPSKSHQNFRGDSILIQNNGRIHENVRAVRSTRPVRVMEQEHSSRVLLEDSYAYSFHGRGMCGSILLNSSSECPIIGMHVAGVECGNVRGISEMMIRETFQTLPDHKSVPYTDIVFPKMEDLEFSKLDIDTLVYPLGVSEKVAYQSGETCLIKSEVHGVFKVQTEPNPLSQHDSRLPDGCSPLKCGVEHLGKPPRDFEKEYQEEAYHDFKRKVLGIVKPIRQNIGLMTYQQVICGDTELPHVEPLEWSTSPGYPLRFDKDHSSQSGKKWLFHLKETSEGYLLEGMHAKLKQAISLDRELRSRGIKPFTVFIDCLKDTTIPIEKCSIPGKTRIFSISPVQFTIEFKRYFQDFMSAYMSSNLNIEHGIGIDVDSHHWSEVARILQSKGKNVVCGDYKNFGPGLMLSMAERAFEIIHDWYRRYEDPSMNVENEKIRRIMASEILESVHLVQNLFYTCPAGIPSGSPITTPLNSMVNSMYLRVGWLKIMNCNLLEMEKHVNILTLGDDVCMNVSDEVCERYNTETLMNFFSEYNIIFTDFDKSDKVIKYRSLQDSSFLKHGFKAHPSRQGVWLATLDKVSVEGAANWINRKNDKIEATLQNCEQSIMLSHGWGEEYYNYVCDTLSKACKDIGVLRYQSWRSLDKERYG